MWMKLPAGDYVTWERLRLASVPQGRLRVALSVIFAIASRPAHHLITREPPLLLRIKRCGPFPLQICPGQVLVSMASDDRWHLVTAGGKAGPLIKKQGPDGNAVLEGLAERWEQVQKGELQAENCMFGTELSYINTCANQARSRWKTNQPLKEGDEDLIDYYYIVLFPNTETSYRRQQRGGKKRFVDEVLPRLTARFGPIHGYDPGKTGSSGLPK